MPLLLEPVSGKSPKRSLLRKLLNTLSLSALLMLVSCAPPKMTLEEAKQVTVSVAGKTFTPPPRNIKDILALLEQTPQKETEELREARRVAELPVPKGVSERDLLNFYMERSRSLRRLGLSQQALDENKEMVRLAEKLNVSLSEAYRDASISAGGEGNFKEAIEFGERAIPRFPNDTLARKRLVELYLSVGNMETAKKRLDEGTRISARLSAAGNPWALYHRANGESMRAAFLEAEGKFGEAEALRRMAVTDYRQFFLTFAGPVGALSNLPIHERKFLVMNLMQQGRILEAEAEGRTLLKESVEQFGQTSASVQSALSGLGRILLLEGKTHEAEELARLALRNMNQLGIRNDSFPFRMARVRLGDILAGKGEYEEAIKEYEEPMKGPSFRSPDFILALIQTGRGAEASDRISNAYYRHLTFFGEKHYLTAEARGLRALLNYRMKKYEEAWTDFSGALPVLTSSTNQEADYLKRKRLIAILEGYLGLLREMGEGQMQTGMDPVVESFKIADFLMSKSVSSAMSESSARAAITDKDLADLIRREQDATKEIEVLEEMLANLAGMTEDRQAMETGKNLRMRMETLTRARALLFDEIRTRFPRYTDFTHPEPATMEKAQGALRSGEALIVIYPAEKETYIWCVPYQGKIRFASSAIGRQEIARIVGDLRRSLAPDPKVFGDIPDFDIQKAHGLYRSLLAPMEEGWRDARDLLIVAPGNLGQIPFSVLPTSTFAMGEEKGELFSRYKEVPWLVRKISITGYPTVSSLLTLRALPEGDAQRKPFVGFGDPLFSKGQLAMTQVPGGGPATGEDGIHVRGIRVSKEGNLDNKEISSMTLERLNPLPDTAEEVREIAAALGARPDVDVMTGELASERKVKTMDLSDRRIVAFASHALLPWDLDGLDQPAIALSSPTVTGEDEDGLLTMSEIMKLRLNADWAVLSACNTGASEGEGAEAVSGLGRAFFYAGSRAVLVTMWPVETTSAKNLITSLFRNYAGENGLSRAQAQRKAINDMIDNGTLKDPATGKIVASYAHPFFWAPYIIMGDGS